MSSPFDALERRVRASLDSLGRTAQASHMVERLLSGQLKRTVGSQKAIDMTFRRYAVVPPQSLELREHNHRAAVTSLYSIFEQSVLELVEEWLNQLPTLYIKYQELPESVRKNHCIGVGKLLSSARGYRRAAPEQATIAGLYLGLSGEAGYSLALPAFRHDQLNLRLDPIDTLFNRVALPSPSQRVQSYLPITEHLATVWGDEATVKSALNALVDARNEAAHGAVSQLWSYAEWDRHRMLIEILFRFLVENVRCAYFKRAAETGIVKRVGCVIRRFGGTVAGVRVEPGQLREGDPPRKP